MATNRNKVVPAVPFALEKAAQNSTLIPWIGAGFSTPYGFPVMSQLLGKLVDELENSLVGTNRRSEADLPRREVALIRLFAKCREDLIGGNVDYADIAERVRKAVDGNQDYKFYAALRSALVKLDENATAASFGHYFLRVLAPSRVITTNYDRLLERHVMPEGAVVTGQDHASIHYYLQYDKISPVLFKLHGDIGRPNTIPFSEDQFKELYGELDKRSMVPRLLREMFRNATLLFIGSSMSNSEKYYPYLRNLVRSVAPDPESKMSTDTAGVPEHFALLPIPRDKIVKESQEVELSNLGLKILWYTPSDPRHTEIWQFLANLAIGLRVDDELNQLHGEEWRGVYAPSQRKDYLDRQLECERNASSIIYVTPKLSNAIATRDFIEIDARSTIQSSPVFCTVSRENINEIINTMHDRRANLEMKLGEGLVVRALMTIQGFLSTLAQAHAADPKHPGTLSRAILRYRHAIDLARRTNLEIRAVSRFSDETFKDGAYTPDSYALIICPYLEDDDVGRVSGHANLVLAFAAQANNAGFETQLIEANTVMVNDRLARAERIWSTAWDQESTFSFIESELNSYEMQVHS